MTSMGPQHRWNRRQHGATFVQLAILTTVFASCTDTGVTPPPHDAIAARNAVVGQNESAWNYVLLDIATTRDARVELGRPVPRSTTTLRLERRLERGSWIMRIELSPESADPLDVGSVTSAEFDEDGSIIGLYNRRGQRLDVHLRPGPIDPTQLPPGVSVPTGPSGIRPTAAFGRGARQWLDHIVSTPASRDRAAAARHRHYGAPHERSGGKAKYRDSRGGRVREFVVDEEVGAVIEETISENGRRLLLIEREYERVDADRFVLRTLRTERATSDGGFAGMTQEFNNVRVEAR